MMATVIRNAAALLPEHDRTETGALLLARADDAESASSIGGESGGRLSAAQRSVADRLGPSALAEARARAAATSVAELLDLARDELRRLSALNRAGRSTPDWGSAP